MYANLSIQRDRHCHSNNHSVFLSFGRSWSVSPKIIFQRTCHVVHTNLGFIHAYMYTNSFNPITVATATTMPPTTTTAATTTAAPTTTAATTTTTILTTGLPAHACTNLNPTHLPRSTAILMWLCKLKVRFFHGCLLVSLVFPLLHCARACVVDTPKCQKPTAESIL